MAKDGILDWRMWPFVIIACAVAAVPFYLSGFLFETSYLMLFLKGPAIGIVAARLLMRYPRTRRLGSAIDSLFLTSLAALFCVMICYAAATRGSPFIDEYLLFVDRALGYDWASYARFFSEHPFILQIFRLAYQSNIIQPIIIVIMLQFSGQEARCEKFIIATMVSAAITVAIFFRFPATTAWTYLNQEVRAGQILADLPTSSNSWIGELIRLRAGEGRLLGRASGLIAFPSFHCATALLNIWAVWSLRLARPLFLVVNALMIALTPIIGGHYAADLLGGAAVTVLTLLLINVFHRSLRQLSWPRIRLDPEQARVGRRGAIAKV